MKSVALVIAAQSGSRFDQGSSLSDVLTGVLASAGYRVVESEDRADLVLRVSASKTEEPTLLALINVNGQRYVTYRYDVKVTMVSAIDSSVVGQIAHSYTSAEEPFPNEECRAIENQLRSSRKFEKYANGLVRQRGEQLQKAELAREEAVKRKEQQEHDAVAAEARRRSAEAKRASEADEEAWAAAESSTCAAPKEAAACNGVESYVKAFPAGRHFEEAKRVLETASPVLSKLAEEEQWKQANVAGCKKPSSSTDCNGLETYLHQYSDGKHAAEAGRVLKALGPRIEALRGAEMRRHEAADSIGELCQNVAQLEQVEEAEKLNKRVDAASGTVNLHQKRQLATAKLMLRDQRQKLGAVLQQAGVRFDRERDCTGGEDE